MRLIKTFVFLFFIFLVAGCSSSGTETTKTEESEKDVEIYTTVYPLQYIVEEIGGDTVAVHSVYPPGVDGHTYEPTSKEMTKFAKSDAFIYIGEGMEGFAESVSNALGSQDVKLIEMGKYRELFHHEHDDHEHGHEDHHDHGADAHEEEDHHDHGADIHEEEDHHDHDADAHEEEDHHDHGADIHEEEDHHDHDADADEEEVHHDHDADAHEEEDHHGHDEHDEDTAEQKGDEAETISLKGLAAHYHTGDTIELAAKYNEDAAYDYWRWLTRNHDTEAWQETDDQDGETYKGEAVISEQQIKAELYDDKDNLVAESSPVTIVIDDHEDHDPHIWTDPLRVIKATEIVKDELIQLNPKKEAFYNENFEILKEKLIKLDERYRDTLDAKKDKHIIVPHAAFGYWEERYGIEQIPISGLSSEDEPSQKALTKVIKAANEHHLDFILYEQNSKNKLSDVIQEQIGAEPIMIHNLEVRTDEDIEDGKDYIDLMDYNLEVLDKITQ